LGTAGDSKMILPDNIKPEWYYGLVSRVQQVANSQNGFAVLEFKVMIRKGNPLIWSEPKMTKIEPIHRSDQFFQQVIDTFSED
jgi:hypothetical protein